MAKVLVFGAGHHGTVREVDVDKGPVRIIRGDWIRDRNTHQCGIKIEPVNYDEEFSVREFMATNGEKYLIAEHGIKVSDFDLQKRIDMMISLKSL